jgi:hypothetical protein
MSAPTLKPVKPRNRLATIATVLTWVFWSVSWPVFWFGLGLIIFARVMRIGAGMRADLEGTV